MWVDRSEPGRPFFNPATEGLLPLQTWFCHSRDAGQTWGDYRWMDVEAVSSCIGCDKPPQPDCPLAITGPVLSLPDRRLACQFEVNKPYDDTKPWRHAAAYRVSNDGGRTWPEYVEVANDPTGRVMYWDARYAFDRTGRGFVEDIAIYQHPAAHADGGQDSTATDYLQDMELWTFGRVEAILTGDGTVSVIYYAGNAQATDIRYARLQV